MLLVSHVRRWRAWLLNSAGPGVGASADAATTDAVQLSVLRVVLLISVLLCSALSLHVAISGLAQGRWMAVGIMSAVMLLVLLAVRNSGVEPRRGAALLVAAIYTASVGILVSTGWSPVLSSMGYVFAYAAPLVAGLLLSWRLALALMLLNTIGFALASSGLVWPQLPQEWVRLPAASFYIHTGVYAFFNVALPLAVYRLSAGMRASQAELRRSLQLSEDVFQAVSAPTLVCTGDDRILRANMRFMQMLDSAEETALAGQPVARILHQGDRQARELMPAGWRTGIGRRWWLGHAVDPRAVVLRSCRQAAAGLWVYSFEDETPLLRAQSDLAESMRRERQASRVDPVTGLPNRLRCSRLLSHLSRRDAGQRCRALLTIRINNLRQLNARFGVDGGDQALRSFVQSLLRQLPGGCVAARVRASVIAVVWHPVDQEGQALAHVQALREALPLQTWIDGQLAALDLSFGLVCLGHEGAGMPAVVDGAEWLRRSELALDLATDPRWRLQFDGIGMFNAQTGAQVNLAMAIEAALPHALSHGELHLIFQPKFDRAQSLLGFEALARWRGGSIGDISPVDFIPAAEASGLITQLTDWAMDAACAQLARWHAQGAHALTVAVNLSAHDLERADLCERVLATVRRHGLAPAALQLEVTESALAQREDAALEQLRHLRAAGFSLAVDDFGTGYSSLAKMVDLPLDVIKIDRSFLRDCPGDARRERVVRSIVMLAHGLKLEVIAEGVETSQQQSFLHALGVQGLQGYLLGRPEPAAHWSALIASDTLPA